MKHQVFFQNYLGVQYTAFKDDGDEKLRVYGDSAKGRALVLELPADYTTAQIEIAVFAYDTGYRAGINEGRVIGVQRAIKTLQEIKP